jgi:hypothetical protein
LSRQCVAVGQRFQECNDIIDFCVGPGRTIAFVAGQRLIDDVDVGAQRLRQVIELRNLA